MTGFGIIGVSWQRLEATSFADAGHALLMPSSAKELFWRVFPRWRVEFSGRTTNYSAMLGKSRDKACSFVGAGFGGVSSGAKQLWLGKSYFYSLSSIETTRAGVSAKPKKFA